MSPWSVECTKNEELQSESTEENPPWEHNMVHRAGHEPANKKIKSTVPIKAQARGHYSTDTVPKLSINNRAQKGKTSFIVEFLILVLFLF